MKGAFAALAAIFALPAGGALAADAAAIELVGDFRDHSRAFLSRPVDL